MFLLSGGTTGLPKLIARTHNDYSYNARASAELCRLDERTVYLVSLPASHNFPLACPGILGTLLSGGRVVMIASPDPASAFAAIEREGVTITAVVPAVAQRWLTHAADMAPAPWARSTSCRSAAPASPTSTPRGSSRCSARPCSHVREKISAEEVENLLYRMPGIAQVAAVAAPDAELGERICVFVVPEPGRDISLGAISGGLEAAGVAKFKWPERLEIVAELPVTSGQAGQEGAPRHARREEHTMNDFDSTEHQTRLKELYRDFEAAGMTPLWLTREGLMPFHPQPRAVPHLWRWADLLPLAARSADLVPVGRGGERRAISLGNPGLSGDPYTTPTLWAAIQYLAPREDAPEHRHTQSAFRFVLEGEGVWTVVGTGTRLPCAGATCC